MKSTLGIIGCVIAIGALSWAIFHKEEINLLAVLTALSGMFVGLSGSINDKNK